MRYTGERAIPWNGATGLNVMHPHIMRYAWATRWAWGEDVVDLGCGAGYGAYILSMCALSVFGVDLNPEAIHYAGARFDAPNLTFGRHNLDDGPPEGHPSIYVAFEVLEHLTAPRALIEELDAPLVWSIPVNVPNQWHKKVYSVDAIIKMMGNSAIYYQSNVGDIVHHSRADFDPAYVLGIRE